MNSSIKKVLYFLAVITFLVLPLKSWSATIPLATVGSVDTLVDYTRLSNSSEASEETWVESVLGIDVEFSPGTTSDWMLVESTTSTYAHELASDTDYFLVKTGKIATDKTFEDYRHFLFKNISVLDYAVVDLEYMISLVPEWGDSGFVIDIKKFSHLTSFNEITVVPIPAAVYLFGSVLLMFAGFSKRRSSVKS